MLKQMLRRLLADQRLSRLLVVEQKKWTQALPRNHQEKPWINDERKTSRAGQSLPHETSISTSTCDKVEGLDITLDYPAGFADGS